MIYLLHPDLTLPDSPSALNFLQALELELQRHTAVSVIRTATALRSLDLTNSLAREEGLRVLDTIRRLRDVTGRYGTELKEAAGLVALGGKPLREGLSTGVDEEIQLAREIGLPVFLIGSVQGRSSRVAADFSTSGWQDKLNNLTIEQNEQLRLSLDYSTLADMVLNALSLWMQVLAYTLSHLRGFCVT